MEDLISYYYRGGSTYDSPFWKAASESARARLERRPELAAYFAKLRDFKQRGVLHSAPPYGFSPHTWQIVDAALGYRSFDPTAA